MLARFNRRLLIVLLFLGIAYYWLMLDNSAAEARAQPVDIEQLRTLAAAGNARGPKRIRYEQVATRFRAGNLVAAGTGMRWMRLYTFAYMLEYTQAPPVLIGSGITRGDAQRRGYETFWPKAQQRVTRALAGAAALVPLNRSPAQEGGLSMLANTPHGEALSADVESGWALDAKGEVHALAPGVVAIPVPQQSHKRRMVYVRLANGREYLFTGSVAPIRQSWAELRLPARTTTDFGTVRDRGALRSWLLTIRSLKEQAPGLVVVSGSKISADAGVIEGFGNAS